MRVRSLGRQAVLLACKNIARGHASADYRRPRAVYARVRALSAPEPKFKHSLAARGIDNLAGLGRYKSLMIYNIEQRGFYKLRLHNGSLHSQKRLGKKYRRPLRDGVNIPGKFEIAQIIHKLLVKYAQRTQIVQIFLGKMQIVDIFYSLLQAGHNRVNAVILQRPEKHIKYGFIFIHAVFKIAVHHSKLI